ncbi:hypothetical protein CLV63_10956 [Murinocardiopsis flavida]|uniref:Uncharacterized protein n=1 Tax=Murinocardiopsis flavida TaxID=645275 RepID=A0A2P8DIK0_9ACTN|nr:hypothetical protein [Murinocardiopsis flavida]PSK97053.1 hypothetical protein CLV63_10956 [Murinocardiopsis flavida]
MQHTPAYLRAADETAHLITSADPAEVRRGLLRFQALPRQLHAEVYARIDAHLAPEPEQAAPAPEGEVAPITQGGEPTAEVAFSAAG